MENHVTYTGVCFCFIYDEPSLLSQINLLQPYFALYISHVTESYTLLFQ
jgi:hypothetical protein